MSIFEIFLSQDDILQRSTGCNKKNSCHQPSLISQFRENVISFNFLANALYQSMHRNYHAYSNHFNYLTYKVKFVAFDSISNGCAKNNCAASFYFIQIKFLTEKLLALVSIEHCFFFKHVKRAEIWI